MEMNLNPCPTVLLPSEKNNSLGVMRKNIGTDVSGCLMANLLMLLP